MAVKRRKRGVRVCAVFGARSRILKGPGREMEHASIDQNSHVL